MITLVSQPPKWNSAYEQIRYALTVEYSNTIAMLGSDATNQIDADVPMQFRYIGPGTPEAGDILSVEFSSGVVDYEVTGQVTDGATTWTIVGPTLRDAPGFPVIHGVLGMTLTKRAAKRFRLYVGFPSGHELVSFRALSSYATLMVRADEDGVYNVDVSGFLQAYFSKVYPPTIGPDPRLFTGFRLYTIEDEGDFSIGDVRYCLNGCVQDLNGSTFVSAPGTPLGYFPLFKPTGEGAIKTFIIDELVINSIV